MGFQTEALEEKIEQLEKEIERLKVLLFHFTGKME